MDNFDNIERKKEMKNFIEGVEDNTWISNFHMFAKHINYAHIRIWLNNFRRNISHGISSDSGEMQIFNRNELNRILTNGELIETDKHKRGNGENILLTRQLEKNNVISY